MMNISTTDAVSGVYSSDMTMTYARGQTNSLIRVSLFYSSVALFSRTEQFAKQLFIAIYVRSYIPGCITQVSLNCDVS